MLPGTADEGAAVDLVRGGGDDAPGPAAGCRVNHSLVALVSGVALISGNPAGWNVTSGRLPARIRGQVMYPRPVHGAGIPCMPGSGPDRYMGHPGNLGGSDSWEDAGSWRHSGSTRMSCANAR
jgi:hypothetical protein